MLIRVKLSSSGCVEQHAVYSMSFQRELQHCKVLLVLSGGPRGGKDSGHGVGTQDLVSREIQSGRQYGEGGESSLY